jgi:hypothetical protein
MGLPSIIDIELAQVLIGKNERRMESCDVVDKGCRFPRRLCRVIILLNV